MLRNPVRACIVDVQVIANVLRARKQKFCNGIGGVIRKDSLESFHGDCKIPRLVGRQARRKIFECLLFGGSCSGGQGIEHFVENNGLGFALYENAVDATQFETVGMDAKASTPKVEMSIDLSTFWPMRGWPRLCARMPATASHVSAAKTIPPTGKRKPRSRRTALEQEASGALAIPSEDRNAQTLALYARQRKNRFFATCSLSTQRSGSNLDRVDA